MTCVHSSGGRKRSVSSKGKVANSVLKRLCRRSLCYWFSGLSSMFCWTALSRRFASSLRMPSPMDSKNALPSGPSTSRRRLGDLLRLMMVADVTQRRGINQVNMPRHQRGKRLFAIAQRIFPQQCHVIHRQHLPINVRRTRKATDNFQGVSELRRACIFRPH
jgi:hypothetical protein